MLADNGQPLALTTETINNKMWVTREGVDRAAITNGSYPPVEHALEELKGSLAHYPRPVTIDGEPLETSPEPHAARVSVLKPIGPDVSEARKEELPLEEDEETKPIGSRYNAMVAGVRCRIKVEHPQWERDESIHLSRGEESWGKNHGPLTVVRLEAHTEITAREIGEMAEDRRGQPSVLQGSGLEKRTQERRRAMREKTRSMPGVPPRWEGTVYLHPLAGEIGSTWFEPAPMWVDGQPVQIEQDSLEMTDAEWLSVVDALLQEDSGMVPVITRNNYLMEGCISPNKDIDTVVTVETLTEPEREDNGEVKEIRLKLGIETREGEAQERTVMGRIFLTGEFEGETTWRVVQEAISRDELQDILTRALWRDSEDDSWDENNYQYEMLQIRMGHLATHILGDPVGAIRDEMQNRVNAIHPAVPLPETAVETTSRDGRWTLRLNPPAENEAAAADQQLRTLQTHIPEEGMNEKERAGNLTAEEAETELTAAMKEGARDQEGRVHCRDCGRELDEGEYLVSLMGKGAACADVSQCLPGQPS